MFIYKNVRIQCSLYIRSGVLEHHSKTITTKAKLGK